MNDFDKSLRLEFRENKIFSNQKFLWPEEDKATWKQFSRPTPFGDIPYLFYDFPNIISELIPLDKRKLVIQAGGNGGIYPIQYSKLFSEVITFEPEPRWFYCLDYNVKESNVKKINAAIGNSNENISMVINSEIARGNTNLGAMRVEIGGVIPQVKIDSFNINPDLIHLDIEGFEGEALLGAAETIKRCKPLIVIETNECGNKYGWPKKRIDKLLKSFNYSIVKDWAHDAAYAYNE